jgi:hypothetical protein
MNVLIRTVIVTLLILISSAMFAAPEDDLAATTGGVAFHLNKADFNKNPTGFANTIVKQTLNTQNIYTIPINMELKANPATHVSEYTLKITTDMPTLDIDIESATNTQDVEAVQLIDPKNTIVKPFLNIHKINGKIKTNFTIPSPQPGIWRLQITDVFLPKVSASYQTEVHRVIIWEAYDVPAQANTLCEFTVDKALTDLSIAIGAKNKAPTVELFDPNHKQVTAVVTALGPSIFNSIAKPMPGMWTAKITSTENFSMQIVGQSFNFIVNQNFLRRVLGHEGMMNIPDDKTRLRPAVQKLFEMNFIYLNPSDSLQNFTFQLVSTSGKILSSTRVRAVSRTPNWIELINPLTIPAEDFRVMIIGKDNSGHLFQRMGNYLYQVNK